MTSRTKQAVPKLDADAEGNVGPAGQRSRAYVGLDRAAHSGIFALQRCEECGEVQYPPREVCANCLSERLAWTKQEPVATLLARTQVWRPYEPRFADRVPVPIGLVRLEAGPVLVAMLDDGAAPPSRVRLQLEIGADGHAIVRACRD